MPPPPPPSTDKLLDGGPLKGGGGLGGRGFLFGGDLNYTPPRNVQCSDPSPKGRLLCPFCLPGGASGVLRLCAWAAHCWPEVGTSRPQPRANVRVPLHTAQCCSHPQGCFNISVRLVPPKDSANQKSSLEPLAPISLFVGRDILSSPSMSPAHVLVVLEVWPLLCLPGPH